MYSNTNKQKHSTQEANPQPLFINVPPLRWQIYKQRYVATD